MAVNLSPVGGVAAQFFDNNGNPLSGGKLFTYAAGTTTPQVTYTTSTGAVAHPNPIVLDAGGRVPNSGEIWLTDGANYKFVLKTSADVLIATYDNITGINSNFVNYTNQQEIQTATAGQTVFNLATMQYQPNTNSLSVFVDGVNQYGPGASYAYLETDSDTVTFTTGLHVGAEVKFTTSNLNSSAGGNAFNVSYPPPFVGAVTTNVGDKLAQTVSVKDFGAVGDGVADDTAAIQAAIDAVGAAGGGTVFIPTGVYAISSTIQLGDGGSGNPSTYSVNFIGEGASPYQSTNSNVEFKWVGAVGSTASILKVCGLISGVRVSGIYLNGQNNIFDGLVISSCIGGNFENILVQNVRRRGISLVVDSSGTATWFTINNTFNNIYSNPNYVNRSGGDTYAWYLQGSATQAIGGGPCGIFRNTYNACVGQVYSDSTNTTTPAALYLGYTDSSTWIECDMSRSYSALDASQNLVPGSFPTFQGTGRSIIFDSTVRTAFPLNHAFYDCSCVGNYSIIEPGSNVTGDNQFINQPTRDNESAPVYGVNGKIRGFNDRSEYFGDPAIIVRGDSNRFRYENQARTRYVDFINDDTGSSYQLHCDYTNASAVTTRAFSILNTAELEFQQGIRSFKNNINNNAVVIKTPNVNRQTGILSLSLLNSASRSIIVSYNVTGTAACIKMCDGGGNVAVTTGVLTGTTGSVGFLTVSADNAGNLYIENRTGGAVAVVGTYLA